MQNIELVEKAFLGSLLFSPQNVVDALTLIKAGKPENGNDESIRLYVPSHQTILEAMETCCLEGENNYFELPDLIARLAAMGVLDKVGGAEYVKSLSLQGSPSMGAWRAHAANVIATFQTRIAVEAGQELAKRALEGKSPLPDILADTQDKIGKIRRIGFKPPTLTIAELMQIRRQDRDERIAGTKTQGILSSGLRAIDKNAGGGFYPGRTYLFGMVMNAGKSTLMRAFIRSLMKQGPGIVYSTEEPPLVYLNKIIAGEMRIPSDRLDALGLTEEEWARLYQIEDELLDSGLIMSTKSSPSPDDVYNDAQSGVTRHNIKWVVVDSASKMSAGKDKIFEDTRAVSQCLQDVALDLNLPVIMSAQIVKEVNFRTHDRVPTLWDFQGGITFAQDMDCAWTMYSEDYYIDRGVMKEADREYNPGVVYCPMVRNRHGKGGNVAAELFMLPGVGFYDIERYNLNG